MNLPKLPSAPRTPPSASSLAESSRVPPLPSRGPPLPSRLARRSLDVLQGASTSTEHHPKLELNLPEEKNQPQSRSVPNSVASSPTDSVAEGKTKKRGRVNPKQLAQLEKLFALETCPSVERRKEISTALGMQERQLQIWFQNRRAKEKHRRGIPPRPRQRRQKLSLSISPPPHPSSESESLPNTPPELTPGFDSELNARINEDLPVDIIPCDTLTIGTWKRLRSEEAEHSLVAYVSDSRECLTWFIHNAGRSFKMIIPFHIIMHTELDDTSSSGTTGTTEISFILSRPPLFFFEARTVKPGTMVTNREWQGCHDWTEDNQATYCLRHTIQGPAIALHHFLETLQPKLASLDRKANLRVRPTSWHQSPSSASEYSCPTPQGSISPLEMRKRLPPVEILESHSPEASAHSSCSGPMGYYYRSQTIDSSTFSDQPSPPSSDDQPSPAASAGDHPSPQATTPQYINLDGSPVTEVFEPSLVLTLPPIVPRIVQSHCDPSLVIPGDYQQHSPPPSSGLEGMNGCLTDQAFAATSNAAFPEPSPRTDASFSNSSRTPIPVTTRYYTLDYGLATGCSSSMSSPLTASHPRSSTLPPMFTQPQYNTVPAGSLGPDTSSYYFPSTSTSNFGLSSNSSILPPPAAFNQLDIDIDTAIPSGLTTPSISSFYPEAPAATAPMDPGLNPELFQYLQQPLQQQQQQHQQPTLIAPTPFSASTYRLQGDWIAGLQWDQEHRHRHQHL